MYELCTREIITDTDNLKILKNMKKLLLSIVALCVTASIDAQTYYYPQGSTADNALITVVASGEKVTITTTAADQLNHAIVGDGSFTGTDRDHLVSIIGSKKQLTLVGYFNSEDFNQAGSKISPEEIDLKAAHIPQASVTYEYYILGENDTRTHPVNQNAEGARIYDASVSGGVKLPDGWKASVKTLYLPEFADYNVIPEQFAANCPNLSYVSIPSNIDVIGTQGFYNCGSLRSVNLPEGLIAICFEAFRTDPFTSVTIPGSVELIESYAFGNNNLLETVIFSPSDPNHHMFLQHETFNNMATLKDVYINTTALIDAENHSFDFRNTYSHGDSDSHTFATLHFSSEVAEHYANLKHPLTMDIAMDRAKFHNWLMEHFTLAQNTTTQNGWWEFINNGTTENYDYPEGKFLRTYSAYDYDRIVPGGVKAYIVNGVTQNGKEVSISLRQIYVIPKRTGVILYGQCNSRTETGAPALAMQICEIANGLPLRRDYFDVHGVIKNYLWPTCVTLMSGDDAYEEESYGFYTLDSNGNPIKDQQGNYTVTTKKRMVRKEATFVKNPKDIFEGEALGPWDNHVNEYTAQPSTKIGGEGGEQYNATNLNGFYRNFYLNRYCNTDSGKEYLKQANSSEDAAQFVGFFRAKKSKTRPGQAYLRLHENEFTDSEGGEVIVIGDNQPFSYNGKTYDMKGYQVEFSSSQDATPITPTYSKLWYDYVVYTPDDNRIPNMNWTDKTNWGDRSLVFKNSTTSGANFVPVMCYDEPEIIDHGDGTATMIIKLESDNNQSQGDYYNLQGVKVTNPTKGIYIQNGKKVVIK